MSWLCWFRPHKWSWVVFTIETNIGRTALTVYQCSRCKIIGKGGTRKESSEETNE